MKKTLAILLAALLTLGCFSAALADATMEGSVVSTVTRTITSPLGGTVSDVPVSAGQTVKAGDVLAVLETVKVYAQEDGIVHIFGENGDSCEMLDSRYGGVAYIEPDCLYTIESASTKFAYDSEENKTVHPGEKVNLKCYSDGDHAGEGLIMTVTGTTFSVEVNSGIFKNNETVLVYRGSTDSENRIGRGTVTRRDPVAYTGEGVIAAYAVKEGQHVNKGDVLFETLTGTYSNRSENLTLITAPMDGVITSVSVTPGAALAQDGTVIELYPASALRVEAALSESDLDQLNVGDTVKVELTYIGNGDTAISGTVERISLVAGEASADSEQAEYSVLVVPESAEQLRYGMTVVVNTIEDIPVEETVEEPAVQ